MPEILTDGTWTTAGAHLVVALVVAFVAIACVLLALILLRARLFSFRAQRPDHYAATAPGFDPRTVLNGKLASEGVIFGPTGRVVSRFVATMEGRWTGRTGTLSEHFRYDSGTEQDRCWTLTLHEDGRLSATADDILGTGTGQASGATLNLKYRLRLPPQAGGHVLDVTDWLYLMPDGTIINRSQMTRFGLPLAELVATMRPLPADEQRTSRPPAPAAPQTAVAGG
ncbi:DUF3833 domain-containing protein [Acidimangrovimonas sediminis]|uniref:DUF3833 domain-containing protein n=1 Tax=Acidimangrovimonas sediminis TaxID=2056283 RepID=UPI000C8012F8|nr:DUF3833 domain-containing protein [Acidimangrovimonas sediminis]